MIALKLRDLSLAVNFAAADAKRKFWKPIQNMERMAMIKNLIKEE